MRNLAFGGLIVFISLMGCREQANPEVKIQRIERFPLADGIEYVNVRINRGPEHLGTLHAVYANVEAVEPAIVLNPDRVSIGELAPKALLVTNAGFFTEHWKPTGFLKSKGEKLAPFITKGGPAGSGLVLLQQNKITFHERAKTQTPILERANFGIQAGPRIIEKDGQNGIHSDDGQKRNRTIIGADQRNRLVLASFISDTSWSDGISLFELQSIISPTGMKAAGHEDLGFHFALNLDGGPSTGFYLRHPRHKIQEPENTPVHSGLSLKVRK